MDTIPSHVNLPLSQLNTNETQSNSLSKQLRERDVTPEKDPEHVHPMDVTPEFLHDEYVKPIYSPDRTASSRTRPAGLPLLRTPPVSTRSNTPSSFTSSLGSSPSPTRPSTSSSYHQSPQRAPRTRTISPTTPIIPFKVEDIQVLEEFLRNTIALDIVHCLIDDDGYSKRQDYVKYVCSFYLKEYRLDGPDHVDIKNALLYYKLLFMGEFKGYVDKFIVVEENGYSVWEYEDTRAGERAVLRDLTLRPKGAFGCPAQGFWTRGYNSHYGINSPAHGPIHKIRELVFLDQSEGFLVQQIL